MERLYRDFDIITNPVHTSNQQRQFLVRKYSWGLGGTGGFSHILVDLE